MELDLFVVIFLIALLISAVSLVILWVKINAKQKKKEFVFPKKDNFIEPQPLRKEENKKYDDREGGRREFCAEGEAVLNAKNREREAPFIIKAGSVPSEIEKGASERKKKKIGEILLEHKFITQDILNEALEYQKKFGGRITQYLLAYGYINEGQLAQCLCGQFGIPYLPVNSCKIQEGVIELVPIDIAERYWVLPISKTGNFLSVIMADPLDTKAIKVVEDITGCEVQVFVSILSDIIEAFERYYGIKIMDKKTGRKRITPFHIETKDYHGLERRQTVRFNVKIDVNFPVKGQYQNSKTKDVSRGGLLITSPTPLSIGSYVTLQLDLPEEYSSLPIPAVAEVVRVVNLEKNTFGIGMRLVKILKQDIDTILRYAFANKE